MREKIIFLTVVCAQYDEEIKDVDTMFKTELAPNFLVDVVHRLVKYDLIFISISFLPI